MSRIVAVGEEVHVMGFRLGGARVVPAEDAAAVMRAWESLADDASVVILTCAAADALGERVAERPRVLTVVMPR
ncbi:MAG: V-type ATP synthase subunit F [Actinomycetota bacterium]